MPLTTKLTVSPACVPVVEPVMFTFPPASAAFRMLSVATSLRLIDGVGIEASTV